MEWRRGELIYGTTLVHFAGNLFLSTFCEFYYNDVIMTSLASLNTVS